MKKINKILVVNGSPRGERSASLKVARAFLSGYTDAVASEIETVHLCKLNISDCMGCLSCWKEKVLAADVIVLAFPLYFFAPPSRMKAFTDRMISVTSSYRGTHGDGGREHFIHAMRYPELYEKKLILVSTCGYERIENNYEAVTEQYDRICGKDGYTAVFCPQGGVISEKTLAPQVERYLTKFTEAGRELAESGRISAETSERLAIPLLRHHAFEAALNRTWDTDAGPYGTPEATD